MSLNLESTGLAATTRLLELASLAPDIWLDTVISMRVEDRCSLSTVCLGGTALGTSEQHSVRPSGRPQGELVKRDALTASSNDALAGVLCEGEGAHTQLGALKHSDIVGHLANYDSSLAFLLGHVLRKTVETNRRCISFRHMQTLCHGGAEFGIGSASKEFVEFDQETGVRVLGLDDLGG